jgi:hypothetical protein
MNRSKIHRSRLQACLSCLVVAVLAAVLPRVWSDSDFQGATHMMPFEEDTLGYGKAEADGPVPRLQRSIESGAKDLQFDDQSGYLRALLKELKVPEASQMLVFSKTSFQRERITPWSPRALFFNDDVYVGYIPGSPMLEIASVDPKLGAVFYTLKQVEAKKPRFVRTDQCLECHASAKTMGVPGHLVRSFETDETGIVDLTSGTSLVNHRTPLAERWGGWYVTGEHGGQAHRGNLIGREAFARHEKEPNYLGNITNLSRFFNPASYPRSQSDIVALMVLEHQAHMHNFITRLNYEARLALAAYGHIRYLKNTSESFLRYLLFLDETPLTDAVHGHKEFSRHFEKLGPADTQGRSLRQFDLKTRMFKYPCSYLIYSEAFNAIPDEIKQHLYKRLWHILTNEDKSPDYAGIADSTKRSILEILIETKPGLPEYWRNER